MKMKQSEFFTRRLHAPLKNNQWSWGAHVSKLNRVFLRIWEDNISNDGHEAEVLWINPDRRSNGGDDDMAEEFVGDFS